MWDKNPENRRLLQNLCQITKSFTEPTPCEPLSLRVSILGKTHAMPLIVIRYGMDFLGSCKGIVYYPNTEEMSRIELENHLWLTQTPPFIHSLNSTTYVRGI